MRKVSVGLEADISGFVGPVGLASEKLEKLDDKVESLDRSLNKIPLDAMKAGAAMKLLSGDIGDVGTNFQRVGDRSSAMTILDTRIKNTRNEVKKLTEEFVKTGDVDVFKRLNKSSGDLNLLTNLRKNLSNSVEKGIKEGVEKVGPEAAGTFSQLFEGGIIKAFSNPIVLAAAAPIAVGLAAFIGAAIGGAIIAAGAGAVVGLGIAGAAMNSPEKVRAAWGEAIDAIQHKWLAASGSFVDPVVKAAGTFKAMFGEIHLDAMFAKASTFVGPLAEAASWFARNIFSGVDALVMRAGPIIEVLRQELPEVGAAISDALTNIAGGNKGAADGLRDTLNLIELVIRETGVVVRTTEDIYHAFTTARDGVGEFFKVLDDHVPVVFALADKVSNFWPDANTEHHITKLHEATEATRVAGEATKGLGVIALSASENFKTLSSQIGQTAQTADTLAASMVNKIFSATMNIDQAVISWDRSLLSLHDTLQKNGRAIDKHTGQIALNTAAGLDNRTAVLAAVQANMQQYQAFVAAGGSAVDAAAQYDTNTKALEKQMRQAGYTQAQIDGLIGKYKGIPKNVDTAIAMNGLTDAINGLADLIRLINHIPLSKTVRVNTVFTSSGERLTGSSRLGGNDRGQYGAIRMAAGGTVVAPSNPGTFLFGEPQTGGEAFIPLKGITQSRAMDLAQTVGNSYGFQVGRTNGTTAVTIDFGGNVDAAFSSAFMKLVRIGQIQFGTG